MKPTLVLLPGFGSDERLWAHQIQHLADIADTQVIVLKAQSNRSDMAEYVLSQAPEKFALAGHSLGGWVAQEVAARASQRVQALMLVSTWARQREDLVQAHRELQMRLTIQPLEPWLNDNLRNCITPDRLADRVLTESILEMQRSFPKAAYLNQSLAIAGGPETLPLLGCIACPTLVICGARDTFFPVRESEFMAAHIPGARMTLIEDCGHMVPMEQPQATTALFRLWLGVSRHGDLGPKAAG